MNVSADKFEEGIAKAYQKLKGSSIFPDSAKEKRRKMVEKTFYGPQVFYEDALDEIIPQAYLDAVKEHELDVVSRPEYDVLSVDQKDGVVVTATVVLKPVVKLGKYEGLKVKKPVEKDYGQDVDAEVEKDTRTECEMGGS